MVDPAIIETVKTYLQRLKEKDLRDSFAVLFGSQVAGKTDALSDIDLIVVSPDFDGEIRRESINLLWRVAARTDSRIEPIPCGQEQWQRDDGIPIYEIVRNEGTCVYAS